MIPFLCGMVVGAVVVVVVSVLVFDDKGSR